MRSTALSPSPSSGLDVGTTEIIENAFEVINGLVRVRWVDDLDEGAIWLPMSRLLLMDSHLGPEQRDSVASHFLRTVMESS